MENITQYNSSELSLRVFNDEYLYKIRHSAGFLNIINKEYIFTVSQMDELKQDLIEDLQEINN